MHTSCRLNQPQPQRALLRHLFDAAVAAAQPALCLAAFLPPPPKGRTIVIGAGKAACSMAQALESHWPAPLQGLVITRYGHQLPTRQIEVVQAAHPVPDLTGLQATQRMRSLLTDLTADDLVLALLSGGASSLLVAPAAGLSLADKQGLNRALLASGAAISDINCVRRHVSAVKGGRLGVACHPASLHTLLISDVPGDALMDIGAGPTVADGSSCHDAWLILQRYQIEVSAAMRDLLQSGRGESIKPGDPRLANSVAHLIATPQLALQAAASQAQAQGYQAFILANSMEGEAREVARAMAAVARQVVQYGQPFAAPCVLLSGGETTVSGAGTGRGGRNVEFLLALALALNGQAGIYALAADTDGIDGNQDIAGASIGPDTLARAWAAGINPRSHLERHDGHSFFQALGDSIISGPTLTNVNDFRAVLIEP